MLSQVHWFEVHIMQRKQLSDEELYKKLNEYPQDMRSQSVYKVPQGKLLKIFLEYDEKNNRIYEIKITGDFFVYPEEAIELMETKLKNTLMERAQLLEKIQSIIAEYHIQFIGVDPEGLTQGILMCKP